MHSKTQRSGRDGNYKNNTEQLGDQGLSLQMSALLH